jgi:hypothetical protein
MKGQPLLVSEFPRLNVNVSRDTAPLDGVGSNSVFLLHYRTVLTQWSSGEAISRFEYTESEVGFSTLVGTRMHVEKVPRRTSRKRRLV